MLDVRKQVTKKECYAQYDVNEKPLKKDIRPIPAADHILTDGLFQWIAPDAGADHEVSETV